MWSKRCSRRFSILFALPIVLSLIVAGCSAKLSESQSVKISGSSSSPSAAQVVRIGHQKFDPLTLVKAEGNLETLLKPLGVTSIKWIEFQSGPPMLEALNAGSIDIARTGDTPPVIAQAAGVPLVYVGGSPPKDQSSAILVKKNSPLKSVKDLKGKTVALAKSSSAHYLVVKALETAGLTWDDIKPAYLSPADARSAFEQGSVDAWGIWDPFYAVAESQGNTRVLADSRQLVKNRDFFLANQSFATENPEIIKAIQEETQRVANWAKNNPTQVAQLLSPLLKIDESILEVVTKRRNYSFEPITPEMVAEQQAIADAFYRLKIIPKSIKVENAVWTASR